MGELRIASLLASGTEICHALGLLEHLVAISHECDYPPQVDSRPRVTRARIDASRPSAAIDQSVREALARGEPLYEVDDALLESLRPTLIITQEQCAVCAVSARDVHRARQTSPGLAQAAVVSLNPRRFCDILEDIHRVARAAGIEAAAARLCETLMLRVERVRSRPAVEANAATPRVLCLEWLDPPMAAANWMPELVGLAGGRCGLAVAGQPSTVARWEDVAAFDPEVVVLMPCGFDLTRTVAEGGVLRDRPEWRRLRAVRDGRVYAVDANQYFTRSGPRLVDSLELLAALIHADASAVRAFPEGVMWASLR